MHTGLTSKRKTPLRIQTRVVSFLKIGKEDKHELSTSTNNLVAKELKTIEANHVQCFTVTSDVIFSSHCKKMD